MRPQVILVVTLAVPLGVLAALPLGKGAWPCCDDCGICNRKFPPECQCKDISVRGCHPECKKCVANTPTAGGDDGGIHKHAGGGRPGPVRTYRCADMLTNFCKRSCTAAPAAALLGGGF